MRTALAIALFAASVAMAAEPVAQVALPGLSAVQVDDKLADFVNEQLANDLAVRGLKVFTKKEIAALVGVQKEKELVGCDEGSAQCLAEIADALGGDAVVLGTFAKVGSRYQLTLKALSSRHADLISTFSEGVPNEDAIVPMIGRAAAKMAPEISGGVHKPLAPPPHAALSNALLVSGGVLVIAGGVGEALSYNQFRTLQTEPQSLAHVQEVRSRWEAVNAASVVALAVGAAAVATGAVLKLASGPPSTAMNVSLAPSGNGVALAGTFP